MVNAVIIDDEESGIDTLSWLLETYCPEVSLVGTASKIEEAVTLINTLKPNLVFLDIQLSKGTGFDLLEKLPNRNFHLIFVTAFDDYAIKAFQHFAIHYLLKPVNPDELKGAVQRVVELIHEPHSTSEKLEALLENYNAPKASLNKLIVPTQTGFQLIRIATITRCEAEGSYTAIHCDNGTKIISSKGLIEFEGMLLEQGFLRIHRAHLIKVDCVAEYVKGRGGNVLMEDGTELEVSRHKKAELVTALKGS